MKNWMMAALLIAVLSVSSLALVCGEPADGAGTDNAATLYAFAKLEEGDIIAEGGLRYSVSSVDPYELSVVGYDGPLSTLVVPELVVFEGSVFDVTSIGPKAFYGCTTLVSADLGNVSKVG
ncbi:MAG: hypothetical protein IKN41_00210, partial [Candidatus Methanomethylophilaceae archaeon]|nr:hypothetical protein [Candidatus Methanomethylophilaceae archaeon]